MDEQSFQADQTDINDKPSRGLVRGNVRNAVVAAVVFSAATCTYLNQGVIRRAFGPPAVTMAESYAERPDGLMFDHSAFDALLKKHVGQDGSVDYAQLARNTTQLDAYIKSIASAPIDKMGRNEKLALLINAYNAFTLRLILDHYPLQSIKDIPAAKRWDAKRWRIGARTVSLNQIEHEEIRPHFKEPRIHFALVCAAVGCPPLRNEVYAAAKLEAQLDRQSQYVHSHDRWFRFNPSDPAVVHLTKLYNWYGGDFEQAPGSVLNFAAQYAPALKHALDNRDQPQIRWLDYDWRLNSQENGR